MTEPQEFRVGDLVKYIPNHAHGDPKHPDCETGVVRVIAQHGTVFVLFRGSTPAGCYADNLVRVARMPDTLLDAALKRLGENDEEITLLRAVAVAGKTLVQSARDSINHDGSDVTAVDEPALTALESALAAAGYDLTEAEMRAAGEAL